MSLTPTVTYNLDFQEITPTPYDLGKVIENGIVNNLLILLIVVIVAVAIGIFLHFHLRHKD